MKIKKIMSVPGSLENNQQQIHDWIQQKTNPTSGMPNQVFLTPASYLATVTTDRNEFPYPRFFRGRALSDKPYIYDREAGVQNIIQIVNNTPSNPPAQLATTDMYCFQPPCGTIFPCQANPNTRMPSQPVIISP